MKKEYTDNELKALINEAIEVWKRNGNKHNNDTPEWRVFELYYDNALDLVLDNMGITDPDEFNHLVERINGLF